MSLSSKIIRPRRNHLFLIAIAEKYEKWQPLRFPVSDCEKLAALLHRRYGFEAKPVRFLREEEATCEVIYDELYNLLIKDDEAGLPFSGEDNLVLVFSGHGHLDKNLDDGYWVPVDAPTDVKGKNLLRLISVDQVAKILSKVQAQHILLIVDACFPLKFAHTELDLPLDRDKDNPEEIPSRWVLTSGRKEPVLDKSPFSEALLDILENNSERRLSVKWLGAEIERRVGQNHHQQPWLGSLTENRYDGGEFYFRLDKLIEYKIEPIIRTEVQTDLLERLRQGSREHFERLQKGRFRLLRIEKVLLTQAALPDLIPTEVKLEAETTPLLWALERLQSREKRHAVVLGEGGMGKTVSLVRLWEELLDALPAPASFLSDYLGQSLLHDLEAQPLSTPIPVFVALNEFNAVPEQERDDFLLQSIAKNYLGLHTLTGSQKNALWQTFAQPHPGGKPRYLLLLDGFNEVTVQKEKLLTALNRFHEQAAGVQMVITSRFVEIQNFAWAQHSEVIRLQPLSPVQIGDYLRQTGLSLPSDQALLEQLANPMMLTLYAGSSSIAKRWQDDERFRFLPVASFGELLWNFNEAQIANHFEECQDKPDDSVRHLFLLRCLVPYLAWRMEKEGQFFIPTRKSLDPRFNFKTVLDEAFRDLDTPQLSEVFPSFEGKRDFLGFGIEDTLDAREQRSLVLRTWLVEKLHCLVPEGDTLRFVHQNFRDFYAAVHLLNEIDLAQSTSNPIPQSWTERTFPIYLRRMLGNIEGEHRFDPNTGDKGLPMPGFQPQSRFTKLLDACRDIFESEPVRYAVWNAVQTIADARHTLAGMDLEKLDLFMLYLNDIPLSQHLGYYNYLPARLKGSLLQGKQLFAQGHSNGVNTTCYSPDGKTVLSGSSDGIVKEWLVESGECLRTYFLHSDGVHSVCYSPDGKKILSGSWDKTLKEWAVESGKCLQSFLGHEGGVNSVCYSQGGEKVLSGSDDKTVKEWSVKSGKCLQTFTGHYARVSSVCYSPDGKKVLSGSGDGTLKEWLVENGKCLETFTGYESGVTSVYYSPDGKRALSGSDDETLREWSVEERKCLKTFTGHQSGVTSVCYSLDGKNILSGSDDGTLKEWTVENGECLQTLLGHSREVTSVCYSPNGKNALSGLYDGRLKEWSLSAGECLKTFIGHSGRVSSVCYSPDGKKVLSGSWDKMLKEWSLSDGKYLQTFAGHSDCVNCVCYSPDGEKILSGSWDKILKEWSVKSEECLQTFAGHSEQVNSVCYSPDGKKVLSGSDDKTLKEWSVESEECLQTFVGHVGRVTSVCYSSDGKKILSDSDDGTVKEWSVASGECLSTRQKHVSEVKEDKTPIFGERQLHWDENEIKEVTNSGQDLHIWINIPGLCVWHCDLTSLHPDSQITEQEKSLLRMYGAKV